MRHASYHGIVGVSRHVAATLNKWLTHTYVGFEKTNRMLISPGASTFVSKLKCVVLHYMI